ncbi:PrgI family protein [Saccharopolyspora sp. NPDC049426]|uniref:PrgI family protein n=1 Tax=Saccharopolyspora sp. NPDC049426 TaxID=3155652 RepID=UPI003441695C
MNGPARIPADVDREDRLLAGLTARQLTLLAATGALLYGAWAATRSILALPVFAVLATPIAAAALVLALGQRDGIALYRLVGAAVRHRLSPRHRVADPTPAEPVPEWLVPAATTTKAPRLGAVAAPASGVEPASTGEAGVVDLAGEGIALVAAASTVNFALRTQTEHEALVGAFARYLHSLTAPVQILIRAQRCDLTDKITALREQAPSLPHPALETAAEEHAEFLTHLAGHTDLLRRQVLLVFREAPTPGSTDTGPRRPRQPRRGMDAGARHAAEARLLRRVNEAIDLLAPASIRLTVLDTAQATHVLAGACNPDHTGTAEAALAGPSEVITTHHATPDELVDPHGWEATP